MELYILIISDKTNDFFSKLCKIITTKLLYKYFKF